MARILEETRGRNCATPHKMASFVDKIEELEAQKGSFHAEFLNKCKAVNEEIKSLLDDAKAQGWARATLKTAVQIRKLKAKIANKLDDLEQDNKGQVVDLIAALGDDFSSFGLGASAVTRKEKAEKESSTPDPVAAAAQAAWDQEDAG